MAAPNVDINFDVGDDHRDDAHASGMHEDSYLALLDKLRFYAKPGSTITITAS